MTLVSSTVYISFLNAHDQKLGKENSKTVLFTMTVQDMKFLGVNLIKFHRICVLKTGQMNKQNSQMEEITEDLNAGHIFHVCRLKVSIFLRWQFSD